MMPDLDSKLLPDLLVYFEVARVGSISEAARRLHIVQTNVTVRVQKLEDALGVRLLDRGARGSRLTPAGEALDDIGKHGLPRKGPEAIKSNSRVCVASDGSQRRGKSSEPADRKLRTRTPFARRSPYKARTSPAGYTRRQADGSESASDTDRGSKPEHPTRANHPSPEIVLS